VVSTKPKRKEDNERKKGGKKEEKTKKDRAAVSCGNRGLSQRRAGILYGEEVD